jgi:ADP-heptose:LPS heptosyltransferase
MTASRGKILVIRGGAIGDFILTLPAIAALRSRFPGVHLEVLGYPHIVQLAVAGGLVDRVQSIEARALAGFFARSGTLDADLTDYFSEFDIIVSYLYDPDEIFRTNVGRCSPAQFIVGPHRPVETENLHASRVYLKPLERLAIFDADPVPRLVLGPQSQTGTPLMADAGSSSRQLALHPGSGSEKKNWPEARWAELLQHLLRATNWRLLLVGGEAEGERLQRLAAALMPTRVRVAQSLPLAELAYRLEQCAAFVGHDSGIAHLSAALGLPGLILWGNAAADIWRPPHPNVIILKGANGLPTISVDDVIRNLTALLREMRPG